MRRVVGLVVVLVLVGACGPEAADDEPPTSSLVTTTTSTSVPNTTTSITPTTATPPVPGSQAVDHLVFGEDGLAAIIDGVTVHLVDRPVAWAAGDGSGGVVFIEDGPTWGEALHVTPGQVPTTSPLPMGSLALIAGRQSWITSVADDEAAALGCDPGHGEWMTIATIAIDLDNGSRRLLWCQEEDPDFGRQVRAAGDTLVIVEQGGVGCCYYSGPLRFMDLTARPLARPISPFPESGRYELTADLDPLGRALAYVHRPQSLCPETCSDEAIEAWYQTRPAPTLTVLDLSTGLATFHRELATDDRLVDFDGRYAVIVRSDGTAAISLIVDTVGQEPDLEVDGEARLIRDIDQIAMRAPSLVITDPRNGDAVIGATIRFEGRVTPGWTVRSGTYEATVDEEGNWALRLTLDPGSNAATISAQGPDGASDAARVVVFRADSIVLHGDGLGLVEFGEPADVTATTLESVLGPPAVTSERDGFGYRDAWWPHLGLTVRYAVGDFYRTDGIEHVAGWEYWPPGEGLFTTSAGVTVGSTLAEAQLDHPGAVPPGTYDEMCFGGRYSFIENPEAERGQRILIHLTDDDVIRGMAAGVDRGC